MGSIVFVAFATATLLYCSLLMFKMENANKNHSIILKAIDAYVEETKDYTNGMALIETMEEFYETIF